VKDRGPDVEWDTAAAVTFPDMLCPEGMAMDTGVVFDEDTGMGADMAAAGVGDIRMTTGLPSTLSRMTRILPHHRIPLLNCTP